ncbi:hypothetical protein PR202_gb00086 [Eleusine coracana subsp. coracana]|uniref:Pollen Ole e 1 allergen and extensin family protein n=1 Tax=Eleusine coracana subsp. coracana TaxID=191504 RepID=A0AAV5DTE7_ELECO|nr:hypothetical protein PR202_gb00086 [Eleusine coracana subsp. coracana]
MNSSSVLLLLLVLLSCSQCHLAAFHHGNEKQALSGALVVGSIHSGSEPPVSGVSGTRVAVRCRDGNGRTVFVKQAVTDSTGKFQVHLDQDPSVRLQSVTSCSVQLQHPSSPTSCTAATTTAGLRPVATKNRRGARVFSAGEFAVDPELCSKKGIFFPPIPFVPEPPNIGGVPIPPNPITPAPPSLVPPIFPTPVAAVHPAAAGPTAAAVVDHTAAAAATVCPPTATTTADSSPSIPASAYSWHTAGFGFQKQAGESRPSLSTNVGLRIYILPYRRVVYVIARTVCVCDVWSYNNLSV